jgi:NAD(P)-dependent dehydrogenase (short-subunit alcohol dehydrogenase family)
MLRDFAEAEKEELRERIPTGRLGTPADVARAVLFLALPDNDWITGQTLSPNGGQYP